MFSRYVLCFNFTQFCKFLNHQLFVYLLLQIAPDLQLQEILQENLDDTNNVEIIPEVLLILHWPVIKLVFCGQLKLQPKRKHNSQQSPNLPHSNPEWYIRFWENLGIWACVWWVAMQSEYLFIPLIRILLLIMLVSENKNMSLPFSYSLLFWWQKKTDLEYY